MDDFGNKESVGRPLGNKIRDMTDLQLEEFITRIARESGAAGAREALAGVGLDDAGAGADVKAIRGLLGGYKFLKVNATKGAILGAGRLIYWVSALAALSLFAHFFPDTTKRLADRIIEP